MTTYHTNNPIGSTDPRDLYDNSQNLDHLINDQESIEYPDRLGVPRTTWFGLQAMVQQAVSAYGFIILSGVNFTTGATVRLNEVLLDTTTGEYYQWTGSFPPEGKIVPPSSSPASTGGEGPGKWLAVGYAALKGQLTAPGGDKMVGSSWGGGSVWDDYPYKGNVRPSKVIYPTMTNSQIQTILSTGGEIYVSDGTYDVASPTETWKLAQNTRITFSSGAILMATADGVTVLRMSSLDVASSFIRNCKAFMPRVNLNGKKNCIGIHLYSARNNSSLDDAWVDMGGGTGNVGIQVEFLSYGVIISNPEVLNGGAGSTRIFIRNGPNATTIKDHRCYSSDPSSGVPDRSVVVFNSLDGSYSFDYINTFPTAAVNITGGYSQNTSQYGLLDMGISTYVDGVYFENNVIADVALGAGSYYFTSIGTHHSLDKGQACFRGRQANYCTIGPFNPSTRSVGQFDFPTGNIQCHADASRLWGAFVLGTANGLRVDQGQGSVKQYQSNELPIKINEGYRVYRMNVTSGMNITITGNPYDGQQINMLVRGSSITSLNFVGVPVDVTGANTAQTKTASFIATYWSDISKWTLTQASWTASS